MIFAQPKFNQFCLSVSCVVGLFVATQGTVGAHVYEDGFVERSLTITIRDGVGYGEYQIGLNAKTADQILELSERLKEENVRRELLKGQLAAAAQQDHQKHTQPVSPMEALDASEVADSNPAADSSADAASKPAISPPEQRTVGSGEHLTDLETIKRFGDLQQQWFADRLKLSSDGQSVELSKVSVEPAGRHPYSVVVKFQFSLDNKKAIEGSPVVEDSSVEPKAASPPAKRAVDFEITDGLFAGHQGAVRYALRARGSTMLLQSNVAPVLVRAERVEIDQKAAVGKETSPTIRAKLIVGSR